ncbi:hypothetical protein [Pseudanabaena sp. FACHB-2040]|uniref:hypothetical protein n=1 Tax=Pseudanabaena sp. FACHB-2040 TaxID=2692859 RepID=UPI001683DD11|nr:hypothetical protein [Pseudanabaena sp. FACHB-2040]MBD2259916.1 hypothetical protein [Pseudanabaena sp. FACHB-2040]
MAKVTTINISHRGPAFDQDAIERAFKWISEQMSAADLAGCDYLAASVNVDSETRLDFNMYSEPPEGIQG